MRGDNPVSTSWFPGTRHRVSGVGSVHILDPGRQRLTLAGSLAELSM